MYPCCMRPQSMSVQLWQYVGLWKVFLLKLCPWLAGVSAETDAMIPDPPRHRSRQILTVKLRRARRASTYYILHANHYVISKPYANIALLQPEARVRHFCCCFNFFFFVNDRSYMPEAHFRIRKSLLPRHLVVLALALSLSHSTVTSRLLTADGHITRENTLSAQRTRIRQTNRAPIALDTSLLILYSTDIQPHSDQGGRQPPKGTLTPIKICPKNFPLTNLPSQSFLSLSLSFSPLSHPLDFPTSSPSLAKIDTFKGFDDKWGMRSGSLMTPT